MYYMGMDVHARLTTICVLDAHGKQVLAQKVCGPVGAAVAAVRQIQERLGGPLAVCFEASCGYGWLFDQLQPLVQRVVVVHPGQVRLIFKAKRKNDRIDAAKLAKLLYLDAVPAVHVPSADGRRWRRMVEHRRGLIQKRTAVKNALKALLRTYGIQAPKNLWSHTGRTWLAQVALEEFAAVERDQLLEQWDQLQQQVRRVEKVLDQRAQRQPAVALLRTIPGVGPRTAEAVAAYVDDPARFHSIKAIGCYFGVVPGEDTSVKQRLGHITKEGPASVRQLLVQAVWQAVRRDETWRAVFERIGKDDPDRKKIAIMALAHRMLRVMLAMLKSGEVYRAAA